MQVPNGIGPGVQRGKRPLFASHIRCNIYGNVPKLVARSKSVIRSSSVIRLQIGVMDIWSCPRISWNIWERGTS